MTIEKIDVDVCIGCEVCVLTCPVDVIRLDPVTEKAAISYPEDCSVCGWCAEDCPEEAIIVRFEKTLPIIGSWE